MVESTAEVDGCRRAEFGVCQDLVSSSRSGSPKRQKPLIQAAASRLLRRGPVETELADSSGKDADEFGVDGGSEVAVLLRR